MKKTKDPTFSHTITLTVGDWSHDGHSKTEVVTVRCNIDKKNLEKAYKNGTKKVGFNLTENVCADYEDMSVTPEIIKKLKDAGINSEDFIENESDEGDDDNCWSFAYNCEAFADLWMTIAKLGDPDIKYELCEDNDTNINVGGYGLFT